MIADHVIETKRMKVAAIEWLRYGRQCFCVATEVGYYSADVLGMNSKSVWEIEVKRTKADFSSDFRNKKNKHWDYTQSKRNIRKRPHYFYYMVPKEISDWAVAKINEMNECPYGVMAYTPLGQLMVLKRSRRLMTGVDPRMDTEIMLRMGSDYLRLLRKEIGR